MNVWHPSNALPPMAPWGSCWTEVRSSVVLRLTVILDSHKMIYVFPFHTLVSTFWKSETHCALNWLMRYRLYIGSNSILFTQKMCKTFTLEWRPCSGHENSSCRKKVRMWTRAPCEKPTSLEIYGQGQEPCQELHGQGFLQENRISFKVLFDSVQPNNLWT